MMKTSRLALIGLISALAFVAAACGGGAGTSSSDKAAPSSDKAAPSSAEQYVANAAKFVEAADWDAAEEQTIELSEMAFTPKEITLKAGKPHIVKVVNKGVVKHEFTAGEFFGSVAFRKAQDVSGEFKAPAPHEIEVFPGKEIEVYLIPTKAGAYKLVCEIEGHFEAGMFGTITVA